jgi:hypothetical protein
MYFIEYHIIYHKKIDLNIKNIITTLLVQFIQKLNLHMM